MKEEEKILPYDLCMRLKELGYNEYAEWLYETSRMHNGEELGSDEEFELRAEGKGDEIELVPGGCLNKFWVKNDYDWLSKENCAAPYVDDIIDWLEREHNVLVVVRPTFQNGFRAGKDVENNEYGVIFNNKWFSEVYLVGNVLGKVPDGSGREHIFVDSLVEQMDLDYYYETFDSRIGAKIYGIKHALEHYVKSKKDN